MLGGSALGPSTRRHRRGTRESAGGADVQSIEQGSRKGDAVTARNKVILLVEDNDDDVALTVRAFQKSGIGNEIVVARDGAEALDYLFATGAHAGRSPADLPEVVLLDLKLPKIDGLEVLQRLRSQDHTRSLPVVVLTSSNEQRDLVASYDRGANSFVRKPVDFTQFLEAARQLGLYWLVLNQRPHPS
jgi:two-component system response regulator